jgi:hypothetical protein
MLTIQIPPINQTRALYAYESTSPDELSMEEEALLHVYSVEEDWMLVKVDGASERLGFVPTTYCEPMDAATEVEVEDAGQAAAEIERQREEEAEEDRKRELAAKQRELKLKDKIETWAISEMDGRKKKKGSLGVGNGAMFFASDTSKVRHRCNIANNRHRSSNTRSQISSRCHNHRTSISCSRLLRSASLSTFTAVTATQQRPSSPSSSLVKQLREKR